MKHYGVTLGEVMDVTRNMNTNTNGGVIYQYGNEIHRTWSRLDRRRAENGPGGHQNRREARLSCWKTLLT